MNPQLMQLLMAYGQGLRPPAIGGYGASAQMPMFASMLGGHPQYGGPTGWGAYNLAPGVNSAFLHDPRMMARLQNNMMNVGSWTKPSGGGGGSGGVLGSLGGGGGPGKR